MMWVLEAIWASSIILKMIKILEKIYTRLGFNALVSGQYIKAEKYFSKLCKDTAGAMGTNHNLGLVYLAREEFEKAEICFCHELEKFGETYDRVKVLGDLYYAARNPGQSLKYYQRAKALASKEPDLPWVLQRIKICKDAEKFREAGIGIRLYKEGLGAEAENNFARAKECYAQAVLRDPTHILALNNAGACCQRQGDLSRAETYFRRAYELSGVPAIGENLKKIKKANTAHH